MYSRNYKLIYSLGETGKRASEIAFSDKKKNKKTCSLRFLEATGETRVHHVAA